MTRKAWLVLPLFCLAAVAVSVRDGVGASRGGGRDTSARTDFSTAEKEGEGYHLKPASAIVMVDKTVELNLVYCEVIEEKPRDEAKVQQGKNRKGSPEEDELAPLVMPRFRLVCEGDEDDGGILHPLYKLDDLKWEVAGGPGRVSGHGQSATYRAPASRPTPNRATVTATFTVPSGKKKRKFILRTDITILDEVKSYTGTFTSHNVHVHSEYTEDLAGNIRWDFEEYYDTGGWKEYKGSGKAAYTIERKGCGGPVTFSSVPVEGRLKVYDDQRYEFDIGLVGEAEQTRTCRRHKDLVWEEPFTVSGSGMTSADPCCAGEYYPRYTDIGSLSFGRNGSCSGDVMGRYQQGWSFQAAD